MEERETVTENVPWWTFVMSSLPVMVVETRSWWNRCILGFYSKFLPDVVTASVCGWRLRIWCSEKRQTNSQQCGPHSLRPHSSLPIQKKNRRSLPQTHWELIWGREVYNYPISAPHFEMHNRTTSRKKGSITQEGNGKNWWKTEI